MEYLNLFFVCCVFYSLAPTTAVDTRLEMARKLDSFRDSVLYESSSSDFSGCWYQGSHFSAGDGVPTAEPCLNCTCNGLSLICYLRMCPMNWYDPPKGCFRTKREGRCCEEVVCDANIGKSKHSRIENRQSNGGEGSVSLYSPNQIPEPINISTIASAYGGCYIEGIIFAEGSAVPSQDECSYCFCIRGNKQCVAPKCVLPMEGCKPKYRAFSCCPDFYDCHDASPLTTTTEVPTGCFIKGQLYAEGELVLGEGGPCKSCFCIKGNLSCTEMTCDSPADNCIPVIEEGRCCPSRYQCNPDEDNQLFVGSQFREGRRSQREESNPENWGKTASNSRRQLIHKPISGSLFHKLRNKMLASSEESNFPPKEVETTTISNTSAISEMSEHTAEHASAKNAVINAPNEKTTTKQLIEDEIVADTTEADVNYETKHETESKVTGEATLVHEHEILPQPVKIGTGIIVEEAAISDQQINDLIYNTIHHDRQGKIERTNEDLPVTEEIVEATTILEPEGALHGLELNRGNFDFLNDENKPKETHAKEEIASESGSDKTVANIPLDFSDSANYSDLGYDDYYDYYYFPGDDKIDVSVPTSLHAADDKHKLPMVGIGEVFPVDLSPDMENLPLQILDSTTTTSTSPTQPASEPSLLSSIFSFLADPNSTKLDDSLPKPIHTEDRVPEKETEPPIPPVRTRPSFGSMSAGLRPEFLPPRIRPPPRPLEGNEPSEGSVVGATLDVRPALRPPPFPPGRRPPGLLIQDSRPGALPSRPVIEGGFQGIKTSDELGLSPAGETEVEPTLPPSLPNIKVIPFVAADAVVRSNETQDAEDFRSTEKPPKDDSKDKCAEGNNTYSNGDLVPRDNPCELCRCFMGQVVCQIVDCPQVPEGCSALTVPSQCCPKLFCDEDAMRGEVRSTSPETPFRLKLPFPLRQTTTRPVVIPPRRPPTRLTDDSPIDRRPPFSIPRPGDRRPSPPVASAFNNVQEDGDVSAVPPLRPSVNFFTRERPSARPSFIPPRRPPATTDEVPPPPPLRVEVETVDAPERPPLPVPSISPPRRPIADEVHIELEDKPVLSSTPTDQPLFLLAKPPTPKQPFVSEVPNLLQEPPESLIPRPFPTLRPTTKRPVSPPFRASTFRPSAFKDQLDDESLLVSALLDIGGCNVFGNVYEIGQHIEPLAKNGEDCMCTSAGVQCISAL